MEIVTVRFPFEVSFPEVQANPDKYVAAVFSCLESEFLVMPKGRGFIEYPVFEAGYEGLKQATNGFTNITTTAILPLAFQTPISMIVIRTMLGFTPPEWAYVATQRTGILVGQGFVRTLDRTIRMHPMRPLGRGQVTAKRVEALVATACHLLSEGAPHVGSDKIHRLDKADTKTGPDAARRMAEMGVPFAMLLYERFLRRPFAGHRDSVSELVGDYLEVAIEDELTRAGVSFRKTRRAERMPGFDQAPDFIVPSEFNPQVIIEAKITEDDGTARDKVTRVQHLAQLAVEGRPSDEPRFEVVACIGGRGFGVRREDMKKLLYATRGKVFTVKTMDRLIEYTRLKDFRTK